MQIWINNATVLKNECYTAFFFFFFYTAVFSACNFNNASYCTTEKA